MLYFSATFFLDQFIKTETGQVMIQVAILFTCIPFVFNILINLRLNKKFSEEFKYIFCECKILKTPTSPRFKVSRVNHKKKLSNLVELKKLNNKNSVVREISLSIEVSSGSTKILAKLVNELEVLSSRRKTSNLSMLKHLREKDSRPVAFNSYRNKSDCPNNRTVRKRHSFYNNTSKSFNETQIDDENQNFSKKFNEATIKRASFFKRNSLFLTKSCNVSQIMRQRHLSLISDYSKLPLEDI